MLLAEAKALCVGVSKLKGTLLGQSYKGRASPFRRGEGSGKEVTDFFLDGFDLRFTFLRIHLEVGFVENVALFKGPDGEHVLRQFRVLLLEERNQVCLCRGLTDNFGFLVTHWTALLAIDEFERETSTAEQVKARLSCYRLVEKLIANPAHEFLRN